RVAHPVVLAQPSERQAQVAGVGRAPGATPAESVAGQPLLLGDRAARHRVVGRMAVVAACDAGDVAAALDHRLFGGRLGGAGHRGGGGEEEGGKDGGARSFHGRSSPAGGSPLREASPARATAVWRQG
ncbi:hypothetical protein RZS08_08550, partial [Arthrospira platensis SPKY1]|nr:hypothetical protein [Arthrospira platensis SPKY1]